MGRGAAKRQRVSLTAAKKVCAGQGLPALRLPPCSDRKSPPLVVTGLLRPGLPPAPQPPHPAFCVWRHSPAPHCWLHLSHWSAAHCHLLMTCVPVLSCCIPLPPSSVPSCCPHLTLPLASPGCPSFFMPHSVYSSEFFPAHCLSLGSSCRHLQVHGVGVTVSLGSVLGAKGQGPISCSSGPISDFLLLPPLAAVFPPVPGTSLHGGASPLLWCRDRLCP